MNDLGGNKEKETKGIEDRCKSAPNVLRNALLAQLNVSKVWLNFPAPKRLPNKRRIEIIRSDWNLLSTVTPMINAWIHPCDRLVDASRKLRNTLERRLLAVTTCLMSQWVHQGPSSFGHQLTLRAIEVGSEHQLQRTDYSKELRYDPSCQVFTQLRRYLQELRMLHGNVKLQYMLSDWLKDPVVPQYPFLQWSLLALTREWRFNVDNPVSDKAEAIKLVYHYFHAFSSFFLHAFTLCSAILAVKQVHLRILYTSMKILVSNSLNF
ncbi:hypothetical protein Ciccas_003117 [Cichlidogyrus casuarinus]|uniref:Bridge-like lipid transfer protein family member 1 middle region domain-containing protein n=1 Tax=Cichlidogyrus casuarinus TaxID=1844966 RepID=A0ABD2QFB6_9PLAT